MDEPASGGRSASSQGAEHPMEDHQSPPRDSDTLAARIRELPDRPGIYIFKDAAGKVLYVGKAGSLRKRAASYLSREHEPRLAAMVSEAADVEFVVTDSPAEALLLG